MEFPQGKHPPTQFSIIPFSVQKKTGRDLRETLEQQGLALVLRKVEESTTPRDDQVFLQNLLENILDHPKDSLTFDRNPWGKPFLRDSPDPQLQFNISHSGGLTLFGFSRMGELGVDVEEITLRKDPDRLVRRFYSPAEQEYYFSRDPSERNLLFHTLWTRKEAVVKAMGRGLGLGLSTFSVVPLGEEKFTLQHRETGDTHQFWLRSLVLPEGYSGAVALH